MRSSKDQAQTLRRLGHELLDQRSQLQPYRFGADEGEARERADFLLDAGLTCIDGARRIEELAGIGVQPRRRRAPLPLKLAGGAGAMALLLLILGSLPDASEPARIGDLSQQEWMTLSETRPRSMDDGRRPLRDFASLPNDHDQSTAQD